MLCISTLESQLKKHLITLEMVDGKQKQFKRTQGKGLGISELTAGNLWG